MATDEELKEFPDVTQKLSAPKKLSAFEKERQAAEEKRRRAEAETAAALKEFEDSFGQDDGHDSDAYDGFPSGRYKPPTGPRSGEPPGYYISGSGRYGAPRSGPGSLGPAPTMQPPSLKRKRALDEMREAQEARKEQESFADNHLRRDGRLGGSYSSAHGEDDDGEDVAPKPTVHLSSLPPATTTEDVRILLRDHLPVSSVHFQFPSVPSTATRKSSTAIATLTVETPVNQIDTAVSALKDKYLGDGFRLSISRHLSSTSLLPTFGTATTTTSLDPFGAQRPNREQPRGYSMRNAPPPSDFAPPNSYDMPARPTMQNSAMVTVQPPLDISTIRAIHTVVDRLRSEPVPERALQIEAMLMALPEVSKDERFSFLYDSRSTAGVYYRYLLWNDDDGYEAIQQKKRLARGVERIVEDVVMDWMPPSEEVPFADMSKLGEVIDHPNYESSDEESDDGDGDRRFNVGRREGEGPPETSDRKHLTPLQIAKFAWLLSRMPPNHARLRKGDVAAVTSFAINHAGVGAEEIVDMLVMNVEKPYLGTQCAKIENGELSQDEDDDYEPGEDLPVVGSAPASDNGAKLEKKEPDDPTQAKLVALYLINDVLHNSSTAGVRNAWKYRQLFESAFRQQKTFERLGRLEKELGWGRIKAEQWKNRIRTLFGIWERGSIFASDVFETLQINFFGQTTEESETETLKETKTTEEKLMSRFKRIDDAGTPSQSASPAPTSSAPVIPSASRSEDIADADGLPLDDLDGVAIDDIDGAPMDDIDGTPMEDVDVVPTEDTSMVDASPAEERLRMSGKPQNKALSGMKIKSASKSLATASQLQPRRRKQAEDMFADSEED